MSAWPVVECDPLRDLRHREARAARDLADWLAWLELGNKAARTLDAYEKYGARLLNAFPHLEFSEFTDGELLHVLKDYPVSSRKQAKAAWNNWFKWGYRGRRIGGNPVDLLPDIQYKVSRDYDVFTTEEWDAFRALPSPDGELQTILHLCGLRRAEAIGLTGKRIDFKRQQIIIMEGAKGSKKRTIPFISSNVAAACDYLLTVEGIGPDDHLWSTKPGGRSVIKRRDPISSTTFDRWWRRCIAAAGIRYRNPHMARHSFATRMREFKIATEDVSVMLGHGDPSITLKTYSHPNMEELGERVRQLVGDRV